VTPPLFRARLARWLANVSLEAAEDGRSRPDQRGATRTPAERPQARNSGTREARPQPPRKTSKTRRGAV
jgi:hypothetical protein